MLNYSIEGGNLPVVICYPEAGQSICTQKGSMSWMSPNMSMETSTGGGFRKMLGRVFSGESLFLTEYTAQRGKGMIAFASSFPGSIMPFTITPGNGLILQKSSFLAMEKGLELSVYFQKKLGTGLVGGEGFIMQRVTGTGLLFVEVDGYCKEYNLGPGQSIVVDTGYLAAMSESCTMDIQAVRGAKNVLFGGEGLFHTVITGPGKVYLQSMPIYKTAQAIGACLPLGGGDGININLGGKD